MSADHDPRRPYQGWDLDPDPLTVVEPEPVRRSRPPVIDQDTSGIVILGLTLAALVFIAIAALVSNATPRSAPSPAIPVATSGPSGAPPQAAQVTGRQLTGAIPGGAPLSAATYEGNAGWAVPSLGRDYLALREPRGTVVTICGPGGCWRHAVVNDYGPSSKIRPARVADIAVGHWELVCGVPRSFGLCPVVITIERRPGHEPIPTAPATDTEARP